MIYGVTLLDKGEWFLWQLLKILIRKIVIATVRRWLPLNVKRWLTSFLDDHCCKGWFQFLTYCWWFDRTANVRRGWSRRWRSSRTENPLITTRLSRRPFKRQPPWIPTWQSRRSRSIKRQIQTTKIIPLINPDCENYYIIIIGWIKQNLSPHFRIHPFVHNISNRA